MVPTFLKLLLPAFAAACHGTRVHGFSHFNTCRGRTLTGIQIFTSGGYSLLIPMSLCRNSRVECVHPHDHPHMHWTMAIPLKARVSRPLTILVSCLALKEACSRCCHRLSRACGRVLQVRQPAVVLLQHTLGKLEITVFEPFAGCRIPLEPLHPLWETASPWERPSSPQRDVCRLFQVPTCPGQPRVLAPIARYIETRFAS